MQSITRYPHQAPKRQSTADPIRRSVSRPAAQRAYLLRTARLIALVTSSLLLACSGRYGRRPVQPQIRILSWPSGDGIHEALVGECVLERGYQHVRRGAVLEAPVVVNRGRDVFTLPPQLLVERQESDAWRYYLADLCLWTAPSWQEDLAIQGGLMLPIQGETQAQLFTQDFPGDRVSMPKTGYYPFRERGFVGGAVELRDTTLVDNDAPAARQVLEFAGMSGSVASFRYRRSSNAPRVSVLEESLICNVETDSTIAIHGAQIRIVEVDAARVRYVVLSSFATAY